jgi:cytochrome c peroxidase
MNCHQQIWTGSSMLEPVRESYRTGKSIPWERVHNLPGFVYFDHSIHVAKGVGCASCHGPINEMPLTYQENTLLMEWCLECHRNPENHLRPRSQIFNMAWKASDETDPQTKKTYTQETLGQKLLRDHGVKTPHELTSCSTCHR